MSINTPIAFIGAGNMATSLAGGLIARGMNPALIWMSDVDAARLKGLEQTLKVQSNTQNTVVAAEGAVVVLAVKPQQMAQVLSEIAPILKKTQPLIISIAAGVTTERMQKALGYKASIVRCMPNTPALVLTGATGMFANSQVEEHQKNLAKTILGAVGIALWVDMEEKLDAVTALSGSGPAYFFLVMEAMMAAGRQMGLDEASARQLTLQTALGAAQMAITSDEDPSELRRKVTSPGGTTEQAIESFEAGGLRALFAKALAAAEKRSKELAQLN